MRIACLHSGYILLLAYTVCVRAVQCIHDPYGNYTSGEYYKEYMQFYEEFGEESDDEY